MVVQAIVLVSVGEGMFAALCRIRMSVFGVALLNKALRFESFDSIRISVFYVPLLKKSYALIASDIVYYILYI